MYKVQAVVLAVTTVFGSIHCAVFPAGKCNTKHIEPVEIDFHKMAGYGKLYIPYGPQINVTKKVDHTDLVFTRNNDDSYTVVNTRYLSSAMYSVTFAAAVVAATLLGISSADVIPAGKCNTANIQAVSVNYTDNVKLMNWDATYATKVDPFSSMNTFLVQMSSNGDNTYNETDTITYQNSTSDTQGYKQTYADNVITQDGTDTTGQACRYYLYPLAVTKENGILYLRCSDAGGVAADTRFIAVPKGTTLSDASLKQLMDKDASYNFTGTLFKLPNNSPSSTAASG